MFDSITPILTTMTRLTHVTLHGMRSSKYLPGAKRRDSGKDNYKLQHLEVSGPDKLPLLDFVFLCGATPSSIVTVKLDVKIDTDVLEYMGRHLTGLQAVTVPFRMDNSRTAGGFS